MGAEGPEFGSSPGELGRCLVAGAADGYEPLGLAFPCGKYLAVEELSPVDEAPVAGSGEINWVLCSRESGRIPEE